MRAQCQSESATAATSATIPFLRGAISTAVYMAKAVLHQSLTAHIASDGIKVGLIKPAIIENSS